MFALHTRIGTRAWVLAAAAAGLSVAPRHAVAEPAIKIGYFDVKQILAEADEAADIKTRLQGDFKKKQQQLDRKKTEIDSLQKELQEQQGVLSPAALQEKQADLEKKMQEAQKLYVELQGDLQNEEQQALGELISELTPIVQQIAQEEGYTHVFEKNEAGLFYAPTQDDLTAQLLRKLNQRYHKGKGTAPHAKGADE